MLGYNIRIALKSLRRNPWLTALLIGGIAVGICVSTTFTTLRHAFAKDPLPGKSDKIFYVRMDNWDPAQPYPGDDPKALPTQISWRDMQALMKSNIPARQTGLHTTRLFIIPDKKVGRPYQELIRLCFSDFFPMFNVPFQYGSGWDKRAEAKPEPVIVIDDKTNKKLFGGANSVGKFVRIDDRDFRVVGVLKPWRPSVRMYDMTTNFTSEPEAIYMPMAFTPIMQLRTAGNSDGWRSLQINTFEDFMNASDIDWIQYWVELPTPQAQQAYKEFVDSYTTSQRKYGRFQRPLNNRVTNVLQTMGDFKVVVPQLTAMAAMSVLFLAVCSLNLVGLLLGKFLARAPEISVRRALGASRLQVFMQHVIECEVVGAIGGILGILLSLATLIVVRKLMPANMPVEMDTEMVTLASVLSLVAGFVAGVYPAWRICTMPPAMQVKVQ
jgi:putative ABC transport system permease protein